MELLESLKEIADSFILQYGYIALFILSFTESIIQPVPPYPFITAAPIFNLSPWMAANVAFVGNLLGAVVSFKLAQILGDKFVKKLFRKKLYLKGQALMNRYGFFAVIIGEPYKLMCWLAGAFKMSFWKFMIASIIARFIRIYLFALLGESIGRIFFS